MGGSLYSFGRSRVMGRLRHIAPVVAALLAVIVLVETTNLVRCPDDVVTSQTAETGSPSDSASLVSDAAPLLEGYVSIGLREHEAPDEPAQGERRVVPTCLCQITFVSTAVLPYLGAPVALPVDHPSSEASTTEGEVFVPSPVPLT